MRDIRVNCVHEDHKLSGIHAFSFEGEYIPNVFPAELNKKWLTKENYELLKAFAIIVRTYAYHKMIHYGDLPRGFDLWDSSKSQNFRMNSSDGYPIVKQAVKETEGKVITYKGEVIDAFYCSSNGGMRISKPRNWKKSPYLYDESDYYTAISGVPKNSHGAGLSQYGGWIMAQMGKICIDIIKYYFKDVEIVENYNLGSTEDTEVDSAIDIKTELGKIGVRGGHAVNENILPSIYGYPEYIEGEYVHKLSQKLSEEFGFDNLETETVKLKWATIAKRGRDAKCKTILYNHTNFSLDSKGNPNSGTVTIIYPFENDKYKNMYKRMADIIAQHMNLPRSEVRIRMSTNYKNKNYYSAIHYGMKYGIKHPLIIEYGYHVDVAGREDERTAQIVAAYKELLEFENDSPAVEPPADEAHEEPVEAVDYEWLAEQLNAGIKVFGDIKKAFGLED